jgi:hypothetical protein
MEESSFLRFFAFCRGPVAAGQWRLSLKRNQPVLAHLERQRSKQRIHKPGAVPVNEVDERERTLLRMAQRKDLRLGARELTTESLVPPLGGLDDFPLERLQVLPIVVFAAPESVGSSAGIASITRWSANWIASSACLSECSISGGSCDCKS